MTGTVMCGDLRYPGGSGFRPSLGEMRKPGARCGLERKLYEPKLLARLLPWFYDA